MTVDWLAWVKVWCATVVVFLIAWYWIGVIQKAVG